MNRLNSINNIHQKYISHAIANNIASNLNTPQYPYEPNNNIDFAMLTAGSENRNTGAPISISGAQRETVPGYGAYGRVTDPAGHDSRLGEVMYDGTTEVTPRAKSRGALTQTRPGPGLLAFLLPGILLLITAIFVITCIVKHRKAPFSQQSLRYYSNHPSLLSGSGINNELIESLNVWNQQQYQTPVQSYPGAQKVALQQYVDRKLRQGVIEKSDLQQPIGQGQCQSGYFLLNGVCYPCKIGYWDGTKCLNSGTGSVSLLGNSVSTSNSVLPTIQNPECKNGSVAFNGKCISCPVGSTWDGSQCRKSSDQYHLTNFHGLSHHHRQMA